MAINPRLRSLRASLLLCALSPLLCHAALFEDQKGSNSWLLERVGHVEHVAFLSQQPGVVVGSEQGVLALLNLQDGSVQWRQNLMNQGIAQVAVAEAEGLVLTVDSESSILRAWDLATSQMVWDGPVAHDSSDLNPTILLPDLPGGEDAVVVLATSSSVSAHLLSTGELVWRHALALQAGFSKLSLQQQASTLHLAAVHTEPGALFYVALDLVTGQASEAVTLEPGQEFTRHLSANTAGFMLVQADGQVCSLPWPTASAAPTLSCNAIASAPLNTATVASLTGTATSAVLASRGANGLLTLWLLNTRGGSSELKAIKTIKNVTAWSTVLVSERARISVAHPPGPSSTVKVAILNVDDGTVVSEGEVAQYGAVDSHDQVVPVELMSSAGYTKSGEQAFRHCLVAADSSLMYVQQGSTVWTRSEALAAIERVHLADLPLPGSIHAPEPRPPLSIADHFTLNLLGLKAAMKLAVPEELAQVAQLKAERSNRSDGTRNVLGTRKLIVVSTTRGRVYALHSGDGRILWSRQVTPHGPLRALETFRIQHTKDTAPQVMLVHSTDTKATVTILNMYTGALIREEALARPATQIIPLPARVHEGLSDQLVFLFGHVAFPAADTLPLVVYPDSPKARAVAIAAAETTFTWAASKATGEVVGYKVGAAGTGVGGSRAWQLALPDALLAVQEHEAPRSLPHHVKVQGDHSMRFKYLNPNSALLVTGTADGKEFDADLVIYIIDTVTGRVMHQQEHAGGRGPVATALYDNVALVHFWDRPTFRWQMSVMELYDKSVPAPSVWGIVSGSANAEKHVSSYKPMMLEVLKQSFFSKIGVRVMTPTRTAHGITPRNILMATINDQVYEMDSKLLDARRPKVAKPTAEHREERLIPYAAQLPLVPASFATYDDAVLGVRAMHVAPADLESTTHLFAWGLDAYYAMLRPAAGFDMLDEDFSFALLTVALATLAAAVAAAHHLVAQQKLSAQWM